MESGRNNLNYTCRNCGDQVKFAFKEKILKKYIISYHICPYCNFLQTEEPYWLEEAYSDQTDISYDTGYLFRNCYYSNLISKIIYYFFDTRSSFIDFGGGYGVFTRLMRDKGFDFYWEDEYSNNIFARGFERKANKNLKIDGYTALEVVEHLPEIKSLINQVFGRDDSNFLIFTTKLYGKMIPKPEEWNYYSFEAGQHISFYHINTLKYLADIYKLNLYSNRYNFHIFSTKKMNTAILDLLVRYKLFKYLPVFMKTKHIIDSEFIRKEYSS